MIIPLFGSIQNRVLYLVKLFMGISKERKQSMLERVNRFKAIIKSQKNRDDKEEIVVQSKKLGNTGKSVQLVEENKEEERQEK